MGGDEKWQILEIVMQEIAQERAILETQRIILERIKLTVVSH